MLTPSDRGTLWQVSCGESCHCAFSWLFLVGCLWHLAKQSQVVVLEAALVMTPVRDNLLGSFLPAVLLFQWPMVSSNLFYYQRVALGYAYCCACIILIIALALYLQLLLRVIDPFFFGLLRVCMSVTLTMFNYLNIICDWI